ALPATYVPSIRQHVASTMLASCMCPVVVEEESGKRRVLHVDPLAVRNLRSILGEELRTVEEKKHRILRRFKNIRKKLPKAHPRLAAERLEREIHDAQARALDQLIRPLPKSARRLTVFVEASPRMVQLSLVCKQLADELPVILKEAGISLVTLVAVGGGVCSQSTVQLPCAEGKKGSKVRQGGKDKGASDEAQLPELELAEVNTTEGVEATVDWLRRLSHAANSLGGVAPGGGRLRLAHALTRATTADALAGGGGAALLVACSPPSETEVCEALLRRSKMVMQIAGVLGSSPEDPEQSMEKLVNAAAPGSKLHLWFGKEYWMSFAAAREKQLEFMRAFNPRLHDDEGSAYDPDVVHQNRGFGEVISADILEIRLLERIMRECYVEEQRCEQELQCAGRVLARTLVDPEDVKAAMKQQQVVADHTEFLRTATLAFGDR
ncbi:unnamed protein product, partial [Polarella glacialis]